MPARAPGMTLAALLLCASPCLAGDLDEAADAVLAEHFSGEGPGAAVAVIEHGTVRANTAIGYADVDREIPIDANTLFDLASVSKHFTAAATLVLAGDGALDVRLPVSRYVPDFAVESPSRPVRVLDLIHHVSGISDYTAGDWGLSDAEFAKLTTETHLEWLNEQEPTEAPGTVYRYNNSGYVLLSLVVERVSGQTFADFAKARLFQPAGMRTAQIMDSHRLRFPLQARGYKSDEDGEITPSTSPSSVTGDGNVYASLSDMVAWMRALDGNRVLSAAQKRTAWTNGRLDSGKPLKDEDGNGYGYGWVIEGEGRLSHSGSWMGTATYVLRDHPSGISVVVLSNDESADVAGIAEALSELTE